MARQLPDPRPAPPRVEISPAKGNEILGVVYAALALLLGASLGSYRVDDPSFLHQSSAAGRGVRNLIGSVGAEIGAAGFGLLGWASLVVPVMFAVLAWRRLRAKPRPRVVGRGTGAAILLLTLPAVSQLLLPSLVWRGVPIDSGGAIGVLLAEGLTRQLNFVGALVLVFSLFVVGLALLVQTSLGEILSRWQRRLASLAERWRLARERRREKKQKEKARHRVVVKHLQRAAEEKQRRLDRLVASPQLDAEPGAGEGERLAAGRGPFDLPLRGGEAPRDRPLAVRRVTPAPPEPKPAPRPQSEFRFVEEKSGGPPELPPISLLQLGEEKPTYDEDELLALGEAIRQRCAEFGVEGSVEGIAPGPVITVFEFQPAPGVKVSQIVNLQDDLALALRAESVRIERLPGRSTLGIEVPNPRRGTIRLGPMLADERFRRSPSLLTLAIGRTIHGEPYYADLASMPHVLIAGATGSGKSIGLQSLLTSILYKSTRDQVQFILIDPKRIELGVYADIPHLKTEVVVEPKKAANALRWAVAEMERRYRLLAEVHVRSIDYYNRAIQDPEVRQRLELGGEGSEVRAEDLRPLPYYVIVIDELADLMMVAAAEVETSIARLAQMARAVGIHLIVATQRPSVDILTGTIKANFPTRISFSTASRHDSRTILDQVGAEKLLGKGDMLYMPPGSSRAIRLHGPYVSEQETAALIRWLKKQGRPALDPAVLEAPDEGPGNEGGDGIDDDLFEQAARLVVREGQASASFLQRRMRVGFSRAARLVDILEREGIVGPSQGSKPRDILVPPDYFDEVDATH
ncbi:MAG TPA: DNA translocase FtsK [Thermoanaerobaculia bacterium]|nr:DNA translocase FtsK [Thermoanaerobaculia bacterium]